MYNPYLRSAYRSDPKYWIQEQSLSISNWSGGLNNVDPDNLISDNEATDCKNMRFTDDVVMEKRSGIDVYDSTNYPKLSDAITWLDIYRPSLKDPLIVRGTDKALYIGNKKVQNVEGTVRGVTYVGKYYFVDGHNLYVYDIDKDKTYKVIEEPIAHTTDSFTGTKITVEKLPETVSSGTTVIILAASMGTESNFETTVSSISGNTVTLAKSLSFGSSVTSLPKDTPIFFYEPLDKTNVIGEEVWDDDKLLAYYLPCEMEIADTYAGESYFPDSPSIITVHNSRLFIAGDSTQPHGVYMSKTSQPLYFPSGAGLTVKPDGNAIIDLVVFDNSLIIGRHNDMYVLYGSSEYQDISSDAYYIKQMDVSCGFMCSRCGALLNNYYIYLGYDGRFYKLNTPTTFVEYLMTAPLPHKCDIYASPIGIDRNTEVKVHAYPYRNEIYFCLNDNIVVVYNYDNMAYTYYVGWNSNSFTIYDNILLIGRTDGILAYYRDNENYFSDLGMPISCNYETKRFEIYNAISYKFFKQFLITSYAYSELELQSNINTSIEVDYITHKLDAPIPSNLSRFDNAYYDLNRFDATSLFKSWYYQLNIRGRTIKFKFDNSAINEGMRIYDVNVLYTMRDVR